MSSDKIKVLLLSFLKIQNDTKCLLAALDRSSIYYRRKRRQCLLEIVMALRKKAIIRKRMRSKIKNTWVKKRCSVFWERDVADGDDNFFKDNFRMSRVSFEILCHQLQGLGRQDTNYRKSIPLRKRIAIALYTIGSSAQYGKIANLFGVGKCTVCNMFNEFCEEVWSVMGPTYLTTLPLSENEKIETGLKTEELPQCFGTIDGSPIHLELAFQHLRARFRTIHKKLDIIDNTSNIFKVCSVLHNFLNHHNDEIKDEWFCSDLPSDSSACDDNLFSAVTKREPITMFLALSEVDRAGDPLASVTSSNLNIGGGESFFTRYGDCDGDSERQ